MATTLTSYFPFDAGAGAGVAESQWRDMARHWLATGVLAGEDNEFAVSERAAGANMSVDVATGKCWIRGHYGAQTSIVNLAIATADATNPRIDRVVLRADFTANTIALDVLTGTPAGSPAVPALTQSTSRWEISLAQVAVAAAAATIVTANITDSRAFSHGGTPERVGGVLTLAAASLSVPDATATTVALDTLTWGSDGVWDAGTPERLTVPAAKGGIYHVAVNASWAASTVDGRVSVMKNGSDRLAGQWTSTTSARWLSASAVVLLEPGDYLTLAVTHESGAARNLVRNDTNPTNLSFARLSL